MGKANNALLVLTLARQLQCVKHVSLNKNNAEALSQLFVLHISVSQPFVTFCTWKNTKISGSVRPTKLRYVMLARCNLRVGGKRTLKRTLNKYSYRAH